jgi:hypothetical protein
VDLLRLVHSSARLMLHAAVRLVRGEKPVSVRGATTPLPPPASQASVHRVDVLRTAPRDDRPRQD